MQSGGEMSTKITLAHNDTFHLYEQCFDLTGDVYLQLNGDEIEFEAYPGSITVKIPVEVFNTILDQKKRVVDPRWEE